MGAPAADFAADGDGEAGLGMASCRGSGVQDSTGREPLSCAGLPRTRGGAVKRLTMLGSVGALGLVLAACAQKEEGSKESRVERGRYITTRLAMCVDCHSPWKEGHPDPDRMMVGSKLGFAPVGDVPGWQGAAPALAGLQVRTEEEVVKVLTVGVNSDGKPPRPPMPPYRMTEEDARSVAAFLKTLKAP